PTFGASDIIMQPDGKILVDTGGGSCRFFVEFPDQHQPNPNDVVDGEVNSIVRLNADGSLDPTLTTTIISDGCDIALQPDGKIISGAYFYQHQTSVLRLNADGSRDSSFNSEVNGRVIALAVQPDGKVLVGGRFNLVGGISLNSIARLNADGSRDLSFNPSGGVNRNQVITDIVLQPDGKILIVGNFTSVAGVSRNGIARLNPDGSLDRSFEPIYGANWRVDGVLLQPDGKVVIVGDFTEVEGVRRNRIARLNSDGSLDRSFDPGSGASFHIYDVALQPGGKLMVSGGFTSFDGVSRTYIARLNADGSLDPSFNVPSGVLRSGSRIESMAIQPDGNILIDDYNTIFRLHNRLPARLLMSPAILPVAPDQTFQLDVQVDMASIAADQVQVTLSFDPVMLEVVDAAGNPATSIMPNMAVVGAVTTNQVDAATGRITFSAMQSTYPHVTGSATVASVYFRPKVAVGQTQVQFVRDAGTNSDLWRGTTPLTTTLEAATVRIVEHRTYLPPIFQ
ncbi:MAG: hypothetical protein JOZ51_00510, partial [Chloroflexi bacterium]|nr:hypothetical protein [Chloroflexota bacterium]